MHSNLTPPTEDKQLEQLAQRINPHSKLLRTWNLNGGVSAQMTAFEIALPDGQTQKLIIRRHGEANRAQNPQIAADEFKLLQRLQFAGMAAPAPHHLDQSGEIFPEPYLVIEYIEGKPEFAPVNLTDSIRRLATCLAGIHRIRGTYPDLSFLPKQGKGFGEPPAVLDESLDEGRIRDKLESIWPVSKLNEPVLLHGDFWPGNILWKDGQLVAVIDWEDAKLGDPLDDVANSRLEILWAFGMDAMRRFTHYYQILMPTIDFTNLPYWDLCAALRPASKLSTWGLDDTTEKTMREGHRLFVIQAFEKLSK